MYWSDPAVWRTFPLFQSTLEQYGTSHEFPDIMEPHAEELDCWLAGKKRMLARMAGSVRHLDTESPGFDGAFEKWAAALALEALRSCTGLESLALAWPQAKLSEEAVQALQVGA